MKYLKFVAYSLPLLFCFFNIFGQKKGILKEEFVFTSAPFKSCHASTIVESNDGLIIAWFGGTREKHKDVEIWISRYTDDKWTAPISVANGITENKRFPTWNPVLFQPPDGDLLLYYKVGPSPSEWWGMVKRSSDAGQTWSKGEKLPDGILGPIKNKPQIVQNNILLSPSSTESDGWKVHMELSEDMGDTWLKPVSVDYSSDFNVIQPTILKPEGDLLQILCRSKEGKIISSFSSDNGYTWSKLQATNLPNPNSGIDGVSHTNGKHYLIYNHTTVPEGKWGGPRSPLNLAVSLDGIKWEALMIVEKEKGEFSYPAIIESGDGMLHISYTYNRDRIKHVVIDPSKLESGPLDVFDIKVSN